MKKIVFVLTFLVSTTMFAQDKYDIFIQKIKMEEQVKGFVNNYIDKLASESNGISAAQWATIKTKIDYSPYFLGIRSVLIKNYTTKELSGNTATSCCAGSPSTSTCSQVPPRSRCSWGSARRCCATAASARCAGPARCTSINTAGISAK